MAEVSKIITEKQDDQWNGKSQAETAKKKKKQKKKKKTGKKYSYLL